jgi:uncharacterized repeat protein (TIGR03803 family)
MKSCGDLGCGTVFKITSNGTLTTLYNFCSESGCTDGASPGGLLPTADGSIYGTTSQGGLTDSVCSGAPGGCGTVFKITSSGTLTTLHSFDFFDGASPNTGMIQAKDGTLYGTTLDGGDKGGWGTVFKIIP